MSPIRERRSMAMGAILARRVKRLTHPQAPVDERGDTLIEVLVALVVLGIASIAILVALLTSVSSSAEYRSLATIDTLLRSAVGTVTSEVEQAGASTWNTCTTTGAIALTSTSGYTYSVSTPEYWNGTAYTATCVANASILLTVSVTHSGETWSLATVLYDPQDRPAATIQAASKLVFIGEPGNSEAGVTISPTPIVAIEDANGNVVTTNLSAVTLAINTGSGTGGATLSSNCVGTDYYGVVTFNNCSVSTVGTNYTLIATDGLLTPGTSSAFTITSSVLTPTQVTITTTAVSGAASNSASLGPVTIQLLNSLNAPVVAPAGGVVVALSTTDPSTGKFAAALNGTAVSSVTVPGGSSTVNFFYGDTLVGVPTLGLVSSGLTGTSQAATITPGAASQLVFTPIAPGPGTAGSTIPNVAVSVTDAYGNLETTQTTGTVTVAIKSGSASTSFTSGTLTQNVNSGIAVFPDLVVTTAGSYTLTATPTSITGVTTSFNSNTFTVTASSGVALKMVTAPVSSLLAGTTLSFGVEEVDQYGNVVTTSADNLQVALSSGTFSSGTTKTVLSNGLATFSGLLVILPGVYTLTVTDLTNSSVAPVTTSTITVGAGLPTQLVFSSGTFHLTATNSPTQTITVTLEDLFGNVTTSATSTTVNLASTSSGKVFSLSPGGAAATSAVIAAGHSSLTLYYGDTKAGTPTLTVSGTLLSSATQTDTVVANVPSQVQITSGTFSIHASNSATQAVTITLEDIYGNAATSTTPVTVGLASTSANGYFTLSTGGTPGSGTNTVTIPASTSVVTVYYADSLAGTPTLSLASTPLGGATQIDTITPAAAYQLVITSTSFSIAATASATHAMTLQLWDQFGNPTTSTSAITVSLNSTSPSDIFALTTGGTRITTISIPANTSTVNLFYGDKAAGTWTITASATNLQTASQNDSVTAGAATQFAITSTALHFTATNLAAQPLTVTLEDQYGNATTSATDTALTLASTSTGAIFSLSPGGAGTTTATISAGTTFTTLFYGDTKSGSPAVSVTGSLTTANQTETVVAGSAAQLAITNTPFSTTASTSATQAFIVTLEDSFGNPTTMSTNLSLSLSSSSAGAKFALGTGGAATTTATLNANSSTLTLYYADTHAGTPTLTVTGGGLGAGTQMDTVKPAAAYRLVFTNSTFSMTATNAPTQPLTVTLEDQYNNPVASASNITITLNSTSPGDVWSTAPNGTHVTTATLTTGSSSLNLYYGDTSAGTWMLTAASGTLVTASQSDVVLAGPAYEAIISSGVFSTTATASATKAVTITLVDQFGNTVVAPSDTPVALATTSGAGFFATSTGGSAVTSATILSGTNNVVVYYADTAAGHPSLSVTALTVPSPAQVETITGGAPHTLVFTSSTFTMAATNAPTQQVTVTLEDQWGNPTTSATNTTLTLSGTSAARVWATSTNGPHVTSATLTAGASSLNLYYGDTVPGTPTLSVTSGALGAASQVDTVTPGAGYQLVFTSSTFSMTATNQPTHEVTVTLEDQWGNPTTVATNTTLTLNSTSPGDVWSTMSNGTHVTTATLTAGSSALNLYYGDTSAGAWTLTVASGTLVTASQPDTVTAAAGYKLVFSTGTFSMAATNEPSHEVTVTLEDQWGNVTTSGTNTTLAVSSTSSGDVWATSSDGTHITSATLTAGASSLNLYYGDTVAGSPTLSITSSPLVAASQTDTVTAAAPHAIEIVGLASTITHSSRASSNFTLELVDAYGNITTSDTDTTVTFSTSPNGGLLSTSSGGKTTTTVTIPANSSSASLYFGDDRTGSVTVTFASTGLTSGTQTVTMT